MLTCTHLPIELYPSLSWYNFSDDVQKFQKSFEYIHNKGGWKKDFNKRDSIRIRLSTHSDPLLRCSLNPKYSETLSSSTTSSSTFTLKYSHMPGLGLVAKPTHGGKTMASCNKQKKYSHHHVPPHHKNCKFLVENSVAKLPWTLYSSNINCSNFAGFGISGWKLRGGEAERSSSRRRRRRRRRIPTKTW